jgi:hypothetical protein
LTAIGVVGVLLGVAALGLGSAGAHPPGDYPKRIWVGSAGLWTKAALGSYCWTRGQAAVCSDQVDPRKVRGELPVRPRGRVGLIVADHAERVDVSLHRVAGRGIKSIRWKRRAHRPSADPHRWRVRLPVKLRGANRIDVYARYPGGDAHFVAGIDVRRMPMRAARLIPTRRAVEPGERIAMKVRNSGRRGIGFGLGATVERYEQGRWVDAHDEVCPDGCPVPDIGLSARPGETVGSRYGALRDTLRFPAGVPEGLYRLTKRVRRTDDRHQREIDLRARVRVRAP